MSRMWQKLKTFVCCGEQEEHERPALVIGNPFDFKHVNVQLAGLSEEEQAMINSRPTASTVPLQVDGATPTSSPVARLDRARIHTRALSNSFRSATTNAMSSVVPKSSGYSSLANGSTSTVQPLRVEDDETPHEMRELLPYNTVGPEISSSLTAKGSIDTAVAGCEEEEEAGARGFARNK